MEEIKETFLDVVNVIKLRIKLLFSSKIIFVTIILFFIVATLTINTFFIAAKDNSTIPIGIVDLDDSSHSKFMINNLKKNKLIKVTVYKSGIDMKTEMDLKQNGLLKKLEKNEINGLFVIKKGFGKNIENGKLKKIIDNYYSSNQKYAQLISDIVLSSILDDVCYNYSIAKYYSLENKLKKVYTKDQYRRKISRLYENQEKTIGFDFDVVNVKEEKSVNNNADTELIYKEVVIGIVALIILIIVLLVGNLIIDDYKNNVICRIGTTKMTNVARLLGDIASIWIVGGIFATLLGVMLINKMGIISMLGKIKFLLIILLFTGTIGLVYILFTRLIRDIKVYQLVGSLAILFFGISGAVYILGFYFDSAIVRVVNNLPVGLLINSFKNITLNISCKDNIIGYVFIMIITYICINIIQRRS